MTPMERLKELAKAATPGPWEARPDKRAGDETLVIAAVRWGGASYVKIAACTQPKGATYGQADAELIAAMHEALPDLLKVVQAALAQSNCLLVHGGKPRDWTCLDTVREAHDPDARMPGEFRAKVLALGYACDHCKLRAALDPLLRE